jgi:hypothetical protein
MNAELVRQIVVRGREPGCLRLDLPAALCGAAPAAAIETALRGVVGVYRVSLYPGERKLTVRYDAHAVDAGAIARHLKEAVLALPAEVSAAADEAQAETASLPDLLRALGRQGRRAFDDFMTACAPAAGPAAATAATTTAAAPSAPASAAGDKLQSLLAGALTEQSVINFLNDLVAFYLIKAHWNLITQRWLKEPVKYADAWLATFYLVFLLVRYRRSIARKSAAAAAQATPAAAPPAAQA